MKLKPKSEKTLNCEIWVQLCIILSEQYLNKLTYSESKFIQTEKFNGKHIKDNINFCKSNLNNKSIK